MQMTHLQTQVSSICSNESNVEDSQTVKLDVVKVQMPFPMTHTQRILIGIMAKCCVLVGVGISITFCSIIFQCLRIVSSVFNWSHDAQAYLIAATIYSTVLDHSVTTICVLLQYDFWQQNKTIYKYMCNFMDTLCQHMCKIKAISTTIHNSANTNCHDQQRSLATKSVSEIKSQQR